MNLKENNKEKIGIYLHIPFCQKKCNYCAFVTYDNKNELMDQYVLNLLKEINLYKGNNYIVDTIYFGGGTPSYIASEYIIDIMNKLKNTFVIDKNAEITIELNPESVTEKKITNYLRCGINRFSMGVQSFNNEVLAIMGRLHTRETVIKNIEILRNLGAKNISIDLMFGNPKQTLDILIDDVKQAMNLNIDHLSYYSLMIKEHTNFEKWVNSGKITLFDDETERNMYHTIKKYLKDINFNQYEISSFSKLGFESNHNLKYWTFKDYLGIGLGATSKINDKRYTNHISFNEYFNCISNNTFPILEEETLSTEDSLKEYILLNMRLTKGINIQEINEKFNIDFLTKYKEAIEKNIELNIVKLDKNNENISFTEYGMDVGNQFYLDII